MAERETGLDKLEVPAAVCPSAYELLQVSWRRALERSRTEFRASGVAPDHDTLLGAAKLECDCADGCLRLGVVVEDVAKLLAGIYSGRLTAQIMESGRVVVRAREPRDGAPGMNPMGNH